jgi:MATE family multidrug resistance protein
LHDSIRPAGCAWIVYESLPMLVETSSERTSSDSASSLRVLLTLAWPIIVSRSTQTVIGISDALLVANLGSAAVAATGTGAFNTYALLILPMGTLFIVQSFVSQLFGKGDLAGARRYGWYGLVLAAQTQLVCMAATLVVGATLALFSYTPEVHGLMTRYMQVRLFCGGAAMGMEALSSYYGGLGNTRLPMMASVFAMVLNVLLNWVLIRGHLGAPAMGVTGSALASTIATWVAFLAIFAVFLRDRRTARVKLVGGEYWRMLRFGVPSGLNWFFEFFAFNVFINIVVAGLGTAALGAMMAVFNINGLSFMPAFGVASAGAILVGQNIGADRKDEVPRVLGLALRTAAIWQGCVGLIYLAFPRTLMAPFARGADAAVMMEVGVRMVMLSSAWQVFDAIAMTTAESLRAAGDTAWPLYARLALAWGLFCPGSYITVRLMHGTDVHAMLWIVGYMGLLALALWMRFRTGRWRDIALTSEPAP